LFSEDIKITTDLIRHNGTLPRETVFKGWTTTKQWKVLEVPTGDLKPYNVHGRQTSSEPPLKKH
jgi:hypothetical protein